MNEKMFKLADSISRPPVWMPRTNILSEGRIRVRASMSVLNVDVNYDRAEDAGLI